MPKLTYTPMSDAFIKVYFTKHLDSLKSLVAAALELEVEDLADFSLINTELPAEDISGKFSRLDMSVNVRGRHINIEVQNELHESYNKRALFYICRLVSDSLKTGDHYKDVPDCIHISILGKKLFDSPNFRSEFLLREKNRGEILTRSLCMIFFEVPKLDKTKTDKSRMERWLEVFGAKATEDFDRIVEEGDKEMQQVASDVKAVLQDPTYQDIQRLRDKAKLVERFELHDAWTSGVAEGKAEGKADLVSAMYARGLDAIAIADLTGLSAAEVGQYLK